MLSFKEKVAKQLVNKGYIKTANNNEYIFVFVDENNNLLDVYFRPAGEVVLVNKFNTLEKAKEYKNYIINELKNNSEKYKDLEFPNPEETLETISKVKIRRIKDNNLSKLWEDRNYTGE
jgi:hypothetical protein